MGFILFGVAIGSFESIQASLIYMVIYVIITICSFSIILSLKLAKASYSVIEGWPVKRFSVKDTRSLTYFLRIAHHPKPLLTLTIKSLVVLVCPRQRRKVGLTIRMQLSTAIYKYTYIPNVLMVELPTNNPASSSVE